MRIVSTHCCAVACGSALSEVSWSAQQGSLVPGPSDIDGPKTEAELHRFRSNSVPTFGGFN
jgi:hypothetical protein